MIPAKSSVVGTFNARRLWYGDGSDGFRVLTHPQCLVYLCPLHPGPGWRIPFAQLTSLSTLTAPRGRSGFLVHLFVLRTPCQTLLLA